jgi:hypothetical protein
LDEQKAEKSRKKAWDLFFDIGLIPPDMPAGKGKNPKQLCVVLGFFVVLSGVEPELF